MPRESIRLGGSGLLALRGKVSAAGAMRPASSTSAATPNCAGTEDLEFVGNTMFFVNAELRFPVIEAMLTPLGVMGGVRGVFFAGAGGAFATDQPFTFMTSRSKYSPLSRLGRGPADRRTDSDFRTSGRDQRPAAPGRPRIGTGSVSRPRARLPHPLRLGLADTAESRLGRRAVCVGRRQQRVPPSAVQGLDPWIFYVPVRIPDRDRPCRAAQRRQPLRVRPGRHGHAPHRHRRRHRSRPARPRTHRHGGG